MLRWLTRALLLTLGLLALSLVAVNGLVRLHGGQVFLLSPARLEGRLSALGRLARHLPHHWLGSCAEDRERQIAEAARRHRVPGDFALAVAQTESALRPHSISHAGAMGVMQLMPGTAGDLGVLDPFDARENIDGGVRYLAQLWRRYGGDRARVAAAYNAGPGRVPKSGPLPEIAETRHYVAKVLRRAPPPPSPPPPPPPRRAAVKPAPPASVTSPVRDAATRRDLRR